MSPETAPGRKKSARLLALHQLGEIPAAPKLIAEKTTRREMLVMDDLEALFEIDCSSMANDVLSKGAVLDTGCTNILIKTATLEKKLPADGGQAGVCGFNPVRQAVEDITVVQVFIL